MKTWLTKKFINQNLVPFVGVCAGALAGWLYWKYIGCSSGTCIITSWPLNSTLYGALMGGLLFSLFQKNKNQTMT